MLRNRSKRSAFRIFLKFLNIFFQFALRLRRLSHEHVSRTKPPVQQQRNRSVRLGTRGQLGRSCSTQQCFRQSLCLCNTFPSSSAFTYLFYSSSPATIVATTAIKLRMVVIWGNLDRTTWSEMELPSKMALL